MEKCLYYLDRISGTKIIGIGDYTDIYKVRTIVEKRYGLKFTDDYYTINFEDIYKCTNDDDLVLVRRSMDSIDTIDRTYQIELMLNKY